MTEQLVGEQWYKILGGEFETPYMTELKQKLRYEYSNYSVKPAPGEIFKAFQLTPSPRVVIIGQDPYPFGNHADGLAFSSREKETPFSLRMILREVDRDVVRTKDYSEFKAAFPTNNLSNWAKQGVLLLNTVLTVRAGEVGSHASIGWKEFTSSVIRYLHQQDNPTCFIGWGTEAQKLIHDVFTNAAYSYPHQGFVAGHPASGAHGKDKFSGNRHFSKINDWLMKNNMEEINWRLNA